MRFKTLEDNSEEIKEQKSIKEKVEDSSENFDDIKIP